MTVQQPGAEVEEDDSYYPQQMPTSARRYTTTNGQQIIQQGNRRLIVHHEAPPKQRRRTHWLLWMGIGMCVMFAGWILLTMLSTWWTNQQNTWSYGYPRTYQTDQNVGHGTANDPISHFIAENLHGEIIVIEIPGAGPSKSKMYIPRIAQRGCCRAKSDLRSERCSKPDAQPARDSRNRRTERKKGGREQEWRTRQEKRRRGSTRRSKLLREEGTDQLSRRA